MVEPHSITCQRMIKANCNERKQMFELSGYRALSRKCSLVCKCTVCEPNNVHKHATALHDVFSGITPAELGAAGVESVCETGSSTENESGENPVQASVRKLSPALNGVLLRTSASTP